MGQSQSGPIVSPRSLREGQPIPGLVCFLTPWLPWLQLRSLLTHLPQHSHTRNVLPCCPVLGCRKGWRTRELDLNVIQMLEVLKADTFLEQEG